MTNRLGMAFQLTQNAARVGWYLGVNSVVDRESRRLGQSRSYQPRRPVPTRGQLMRELGALLLEDARGVRDGLYPPNEGEDGSLRQHMGRLSACLLYTSPSPRD